MSEVIRTVADLDREEVNVGANGCKHPVGDRDHLAADAVTLDDGDLHWRDLHPLLMSKTASAIVLGVAPQWTMAP